MRLTLLDGLTGPDADIAGATPDNDLAAARGDLVLIIATPVASGGAELNDGVASSSGTFKREFCFINTRVAVSGATFDYTIIRGQQGPAARAWTAASNPQCWIVRAADLATWNDPSLAGLVSGGGFAYPGGAVSDPTGAASGSDRVNRGGSWNDPASQALSAYRHGYSPTRRDSRLGFRVALVPVK